jgi:glycosyltransferase involved in cell wall biosynthesis
MVTVIVPVYNAARFIAQTIESVLQQHYTDYELLLVDDGSTDDSPAILQQYASATPARIQVLHHPGHANRGVSATRNLGLSRARGRYTAFLDSDDLWYPEKLAIQVETMEHNPSLGLTFTRAHIIRDEQDYDFLEGIESVGRRAPPCDCREAMHQIVTMYLNYIFSTVMVRTDTIRAVDGFIEDLPYQSEDRIMVAKVSSRHPIARINRALCGYRAHGESYSARLVRRGYAEAVFFDMQVRIAQWLHNEEGKPDWAREMALEILPPMFVRAVRCTRRPSIFANVLANYFRISYVCGFSPFTIMRYATHKTWVGDLAARLKARLPGVHQATATRQRHE